MPPSMKTLLAKYRGGGMGFNRRFSSSSSNGGAGQIAWTYRRFISFGVGYGLGVFVLGDKVAEVDQEDRQKYLRDVYGESSKIVDRGRKCGNFESFQVST